MATNEQKLGHNEHVGTSHPVLTVIEQHLPTITQLAKEYSQLTDNQEQQRYIDGHYGFLADGLVEVGTYTMEPHDIVTIWSRAGEMFSYYQRHAFAGMVSSTYAIQGLDNPGWKKFPRHYLETGELPTEVINDKLGLEHVVKRLNEISKNLEELGAPVTPLIREIVENFGNGFTSLYFPVQDALEM